MPKEKVIDDDVVVVGAESHPFRDAYHLVLKMSWPTVLASIAGGFLAMNVLFAVAYVAVGGVFGVQPGSFRDAFFFSVQTMGTIGYGAMYPVTTAAHSVVVAESVVGLIITALATGIVFARFSQSSGRLVFSRAACISPMDGVPTLSFRVGNDRASTIFEATIRVAIIRTEHTAEGVVFYKLLDLPLVRDRSQAIKRSWTVMHVIDERSPLFGATPASLVTGEIELAVSLVGTDDTSLQPVHARYRYIAKEIIWGARLADVLSELPDGRLQLDLHRFHDVIATEPTASFPYPE